MEGAPLRGRYGDDCTLVQEMLGQVITKLEENDNRLLVGLGNGRTIALFDDGQSCCEDRHMTIEDDLNYHVGGTLQNIEVRDAPVIEDNPNDIWGDVHEVQFLVITTSKGVLTIANHNIHNGYYGGFSLWAEEVTP